MEKKSRDFIMGKIYFKNKDYKMAENSLLEYLNSRPEDFQALKLMAQVYENLKDFSKAFEMYERCYLAEPERKGVLLDICRLLLINDTSLDDVDPTKWLKLAIQTFPSNPIVANLRKSIQSDPDTSLNKIESKTLDQIFTMLERIEARLAKIEEKLNAPVKQTDNFISFGLKQVENSPPSFKQIDSSPAPVKPADNPASLFKLTNNSFINSSTQPISNTFTAFQPTTNNSFSSMQPINNSFTSIQPAKNSFTSLQPDISPAHLQLTKNSTTPLQLTKSSPTPVQLTNTSGWSSPQQANTTPAPIKQFGTLPTPVKQTEASPAPTKQDDNSPAPIKQIEEGIKKIDLPASEPVFGSAFGSSFGSSFGSFNQTADFNLFNPFKMLAEKHKNDDKVNEPAKSEASPFKTTFGAQPTESKSDEEDGEDELVKNEELPIENTCDMKPIEVKSGEEDEDLLFEHRCKLYRFRDKEYKERGVGNIKVLKNRTTGKGRLIMRRELINLVCLNLWSCKKVDRVRDTQVRFAGMDASDDEPEVTVFLAKFRTQELTDTFYSHITKLFAEEME